MPIANHVDKDLQQSILSALTTAVNETTGLTDRVVPTTTVTDSGEIKVTHARPDGTTTTEDVTAQHQMSKQDIELWKTEQKRLKNIAALRVGNAGIIPRKGGSAANSSDRLSKTGRHQLRQLKGTTAIIFDGARAVRVNLAEAYTRLFVFNETQPPHLKLTDIEIASTLIEYFDEERTVHSRFRNRMNVKRYRKVYNGGHLSKLLHDNHLRPFVYSFEYYKTWHPTAAVRIAAAMKVDPAQFEIPDLSHLSATLKAQEIWKYWYDPDFVCVYQRPKGKRHFVQIWPPLALPEAKRTANIRRKDKLKAYYRKRRSKKAYGRFYKIPKKLRRLYSPPKPKPGKKVYVSLPEKTLAEMPAPTKKDPNEPSGASTTSA